MNFAADQNMMLHPALVIAPQCPAQMSWSNFSRDKNSTEMHLQPTPTKPMELLIGLIHQLIKTLPVDSNRIYITGLSMGGYGTYDAIERYPNLFAAALPVCGGGDVSKVASIVHIPIWIVHGEPSLFFGHAAGVNKGRRSSRVHTISGSGPFFMAGCI
jgi:predicted peptidase